MINRKQTGTYIKVLNFGNKEKEWNGSMKKFYDYSNSGTTRSKKIGTHLKYKTGTNITKTFGNLSKKKWEHKMFLEFFWNSGTSESQKMGTRSK